MKKSSPFAQNFDQLPQSLPIFPLNNAFVLPGGLLPLNIFEPRYLNMFHDAMRSDQLIGMIQPRDDNDVPNLFEVGCAARVTRYEETIDGRLEVGLTGLCRFRVMKEIPSIRGYRVVAPDWSNFHHDFTIDDKTDKECKFLLNGALRQYFIKKNIDVDWDSFSQVSSEILLNNLISQLQLDSKDKQLLLETPELSARIKSFCAILGNEDAFNSNAH